MSFQNFKIFSTREVEEIRRSVTLVPTQLPSRFQVGQDVKLWVWEPEEVPPTPEPILGVVVRVGFGSVDPGSGVTYAVAFKLVGAPWWVVVEEMRGNLTEVEQLSFTPGEDMVEMTSGFKAGLRRSQFEAIPGGATTESPPTGKASLSLVSPPEPER